MLCAVHVAAGLNPKDSCTCCRLWHQGCCASQFACCCTLQGRSARERCACVQPADCKSSFVLHMCSLSMAISSQSNTSITLFNCCPALQASSCIHVTVKSPFQGEDVGIEWLLTPFDCAKDKESEKTGLKRCWSPYTHIVDLYNPSGHCHRSHDLICT